MKSKLFLLIFALFFLSFTLTNNSYSEPRRVLLEFCTGTWCPWCPCGDYTAEQILTAHPQTMVIAYHGPLNYGGDPFTNFSGHDIIQLMGFSAYPTGVIDRGNSSYNFDYNQWTNAVNQRYSNSPNSNVSLEVASKSYNSSTHEFTARINATALVNMTGTYRISCVITEDNIVYSQSSNNVCIPGGSSYVHKWIARDMIGSADGDTLNPGSWMQNQTLTENISTTLDAGWVADNCNLNVFVFKDTSPMYMSDVQQTLGQSVTLPLGVSNGNNQIPRDYSLSQNYPNPFNPTTHVKFTLPKDGNVSLKVYDMLGNEVAVYVNGVLKAGTYNADIDGSNWASGVYFYKLTTNEFTATKKMMLVK